MKQQDSRFRTKSLVSFGAIALLAVGAATAQVASGTTGIDNTGDYRSEVSACMTGKTQQDQATCLQEARNAQADKRRGVLDSSGDLQANAMARCDIFTAASDKAACRDRVAGQGTTDGSVAGGGVIRSLEVQTTAMGSN